MTGFIVGLVLGIVIGALGLAMVAIIMGKKKFPYEEEE